MAPDTVSHSAPSDFKVGAWWARPLRNELERADEVVRVEARSMAVLVCLARHTPKLVDKQTLLDEVWSDGPFVGDDAISHAIWELRKALGDSARAPEYIETVARKGYRLVAEVLRPQGAPLPIEGVQIDHYDIGEELGRGAMGVVYQARDRRLGRTVAIKFLAPELTRDPKACQRFEREARLAASLEHPNLATVHEIGETSGGYRYLVGAHYGGGSLKDRLAEGPIGLEPATRWLRQLLAGLGAAHQRSIVHRDIKPANLLLDEHGTLKICDFGIAKLLGATDLTRTGTPLGTPAYQSPEQTRGIAVDHRTDLWSAGVVFYELLTGRRPFEGAQSGEVVLDGVVGAEGRALPDGVRRFLRKALASDPAARFQDAEAMGEALKKIGQRAPIASHLRRLAWPAVAVMAVGFALWRLGDLTGLSPTSFLGSSPPPSAEASFGRERLVQGWVTWLEGNDLKRIAAVRENLEAAARLMPASAEAQGTLALFLADRYGLPTGTVEDRDRSQALATHAQDLDPTTSIGWIAEARLAYFDSDLETADRLASKSIEIEPACGDQELCDWAYVILAEVREAQGRLDEAHHLLEGGTGTGGGRIRCRIKRAGLYQRHGDDHGAEAEYRTVLRMDPDQTTALSLLAQLYTVSGQVDKALPLLRNLHRATEDPDVLLRIGYVQYQRGLWEYAIGTYREAYVAYQEAGRLVPTPLMAIGDIHWERGDRAAALVEYEEALRIFDLDENPTYNRIAQRLVCVAKLGRVAEAEAGIREHLPVADEIPSLLVYAARIFAIKGDRQMLLSLAARWIESGGSPSRLKDDPSFRPYEEDPEFLRIVSPGLIADP